MSFPWERGFASSSYSMSRSYQNSVIEDYIDSDDEQPRNSYIHKLPPKPRTQKPKAPKKTLISRDDYVEKIEFFSCKICKNTYNSKSSLNRHFKTAHGLDKDVKVKKAASVASKSNALRAPSRRFRCKQCGKELTSEAFLDRHMATHDRSVQPKPKTTKKVSNTTVNINVYNTNNYNYSMANNDMNAGPRSIWD